MSPDPSQAPLTAWLVQRALPVWWEQGADRVAGGFYEALDAEGRPVQAPRRARVAARQTFVYAAAHRHGAPGPWAEAAEHGLAFIIERFLQPDGLMRTRVSHEGRPMEEGVSLYDQAFCLFAFAAAAQAGLGRQHDLFGRAGRLLDRLEREWTSPHGGFVERIGEPYQSNAHMHLFEAAMALEEAGAGPRYGALADDIARLALDRFIDARSGALREFFAADWSPAEGAAGAVVEPGHQFEWCWLLTSWARRRGRPDAAAAAERLYEIGDRYGVDRARGVAVDQLDAALALVSGHARLWPQTERIKAAAILAETAEPDRRDKLRDDLALAAGGLRLYLEPLDSGLWRDKLLPDGRFVDEPSPASSFYHIALALFDARTRANAL